MSASAADPSLADMLIAVAPESLQTIQVLDQQTHTTHPRVRKGDKVRMLPIEGA